MKKADSLILSQHQPVNGHVCYCTEPRLRRVMPKLISFNYGWRDSIEYDLACLAGGGGGFSLLNRNNRAQVLLDDIKEVGLGAHRGTEVIVLNHQDCGAYKLWAGVSFESGQEEEERVFHHAELKKAGEFLEKQLPGVLIRLGYVYIGARGKWQLEQVILD